MNASALWNQTLQALSGSIGHQNVEIWFKSGIPQGLEGGEFTVQVPNRFYATKASEYGAEANGILSAFAGRPVRIRFIHDDTPTRPEPEKVSPEPEPEKPSRRASDAPDSVSYRKLDTNIVRSMSGALRGAPEPLGVDAVLMLLALFCHGAQNEEVWPSVKRLCSITKMSRSHALQQLSKLKRSGLVTSRRTGRENRYTVKI